MEFSIIYFYLWEGRKLLLKLSNNMNSNRYFSDLSDFYAAGALAPQQEKKMK